MATDRRLPVLPGADWLWDNEPCRAVCPVHTDAGAYVAAIAAGRDGEAYRIARATNPFPSICGRICAAPCEAVCRRGAIDAPVAIRALKRFAAGRCGVESPDGAAAWHAGHGVVPPASGPSVGIIGGGPGGLAAAHDLRLAGHPVVLYEAAERLGGMMVLGIPEFRLPRPLIDAEIGAILELGIVVHTGCRVGRDVSLAELRARHAALFIAVGTGQGRLLDIPGRDLDGVVRALEFLLNANRGYRVDLRERVVVVGGGNVALDAARTALRSQGGQAQSLTTTLDAARAAKRSGVREVTILALESPEEMPAANEEIAQALEEGITIRHRTGIRRILGDGRVRAAETVGVASVFDARGRFAPVYVEGSEAELAADSVIFAVGQQADLGCLGERDVLARSPIGGVAVDPLTLVTSDPGIWAGGDVAFGPRNLIDAIADGRRAAAAISRALRHEPAPAPAPRRVRLARRPALRDPLSDYDSSARHPIPGLPTERRTGPAEVEVGFGEPAARAEADRCLHCFDNVMLQGERCILCGLCVDVCPYHCLSIGRADQCGVGQAGQLALCLDEARCIRCGLCVTRCPPGALVMAHAELFADA